MDEEEKTRRKKDPINKGFYIKFSDRDPRDLAIWEMLIDDLADPSVNVSAAMKAMLYDWQIARRANGSLIPGILGLRVPGGGSSQIVPVTSAPVLGADITADDDLAKNLFGFDFSEM